MYFDKNLSLKTLDLKEKDAIELIADNMISTRPIKEVCYRPFLNQKGVTNLTELDFDEIDLSAYYPDAKEGDFVYLRVGMTSDIQKEIVATVAGNVELFYGGKSILTTKQVEIADKDVYEYVPVVLQPGINELVIKCTCHNGSFRFYFLTALGLFIVMKARDYLFHTRTVIARGEYMGEDGYEISRLYHKDEVPAEVEYVYPAPSKPCNTINFSNLHTKDLCGIALTYAKEDCTLTIHNEEEIGVFVNQKEVTFSNPLTLQLKKGDEVLVSCTKKERFGFSYTGEHIGIEFLTSQRKHGIDWLLLTLPEAPQNFCVNFKTPYEINHEKRFWRFSDASHLRVHLETSFFGQWFYALMVGNYGLLKAWEATGREDYREYFIKNMKTMLAYYDYTVYDATLSGEASFLQRGKNLDNLDAIGTMGMNFLEYYQLTGDEKALHVVDILKQAMFTKIRRFPDGTFRRTSTMWADDTFMSCPFLIRLATLSEEECYYNELKTQLSGFKKRLYMEDKKIFSHIFFPDTGLMNRIPWGRGNGWVMLTLTEILLKLPKDHCDYSFYAQLLKEFSEGVLALQDENGMWHQVLDIEDSYIETSCTAMFSLCFARGVSMGILEKEKFTKAAKRGVDALLTYSVDKDGNLYGVCKGSGCSMEAKYYTCLETAYNDDHGTGIVLCAISAVSKL